MAIEWPITSCNTWKRPRTEPAATIAHIQMGRALARESLSRSLTVASVGRWPSRLKSLHAASRRGCELPRRPRSA
jgi:hypothetical protein